MSHEGNDQIFDAMRDELGDEETGEQTLSEKLDEISARISPEIKALSRLSPEEFRKAFQPIGGWKKDKGK